MLLDRDDAYLLYYHFHLPFVQLFLSFNPKVDFPWTEWGLKAFSSGFPPSSLLIWGLVTG